MNQILSIEPPKRDKKKKSRNIAPTDIEKILKFFAIGMLIYGVFMISSGSYAIYQNSRLIENASNPTIYIEETSATAITIQITHNKELSKVSYYWNNQEPVELDCIGKQKVEQKIDIPNGKNTLTINAIDVNGLESKTQKQYEVQGDINIEFKVLENSFNNVLIKVEGKEQLSYLTYRWDDEQETRIEINNNTIEETISVPSGLHTLTVIAVDINNKTEQKEQKVEGVPKPKVEVTTDGSENFIIKASDEKGIKKVEFIIDETEKNRINLDQALPIEERKEFEYSYPLHDGENKLEVRVYNEIDINEVVRVKVIK